METKHTPGEWYIEEYSGYSTIETYSDIILRTPTAFCAKKVDLERIVTCVNAMDGLTNQQVKELRVERDKMLKSFERILKMVKTKSELDTSCMDHSSTIRRLARIALENADLYLEDK